MVAATETAPIERIPLKKMEGPKTTEGPNERTAAPPLHSPHDNTTAAQPAQQPPRRCAAVQKARGPQKSYSPRFAIICGRSDLCRAYVRVCPLGPLPYRYAQKP